MILLNLLFMVQSFAFESEAVRTPYFINSTTGETLIEVNHAGSIHFEKCQMVTIKFDSPVDTKNLTSCEAITADLELKSETDFQTYRYLISTELKKQMSRGWWKNLVAENYILYSSAFASGTLLEFVIKKGRLPVWPSLIIGSGALVAVVSKNVIDSLYRITKYNQFTRSVGLNEGLIPLIVSDVPRFIDVYVKAVKNVTPQDLRAATLSPRKN